MTLLQVRRWDLNFWQCGWESSFSCEVWAHERFWYSRPVAKLEGTKDVKKWHQTEDWDHLFCFWPHPLEEFSVYTFAKTPFSLDASWWSTSATSWHHHFEITFIAGRFGNYQGMNSVRTLLRALVAVSTKTWAVSEETTTGFWCKRCATGSDIQKWMQWMQIIFKLSFQLMTRMIDFD